MIRRDSVPGKVVGNVLDVYRPAVGIAVAAAVKGSLFIVAVST